MFESIPTTQLERMYQAAEIVSETMRVLQKSDTNIVGEILKTTDEFNEWEHVPAEDVYDRESHAQYYYHAHKKSTDGTNLHDDEHGHFHTFIRGKGMPEDIMPLPLEDHDSQMNISDIVTHLIGIGMNANGIPMRLFTVNRWVTGEVWYKSEDIITLLDRFEIDDTRPSWPLNLWVSNLIILYRPLIEELIKQRDVSIAEWQKNNPNNNNVYEDRKLEVTSYQDIDLANYVSALENEIKQRVA